jgi:hypothetical protein
MRPAQFWVYVGIYISVIGLMLLINYSIYLQQDLYKTLSSLFDSLYIQFLILETFILLLWGAINCGSAINAEKTERTYDFFKMLPLPAYKKMLGILIGSNLVVLLLAGINLVFMVFFGVIGTTSSKMLLETLFALACGAFLLNTIGLLSSLCSKTKAKGSKVGVIIVLLIFGIPFLMHAVFAISQVNKLEGMGAKFYGLTLPVLVLAGLIMLYFTAWNIIGIIRKFNKDLMPLFTRFGSLLYLIGYEAILLGLLLPHLCKYTEEMLMTYWWLSIVPVVFIPFGASLDIKGYQELAASYRTKISSPARRRFVFLTMSNVALGIVIFLIWAIVSFVFFLVPSIFQSHPPYDIIRLTLVILTFAGFYIFLLLLVEFGLTYQTERSRIGLLAVFIGVVYVILPLIIGGIFDNEKFVSFSPAGFFVLVVSDELKGIVPFIKICLYNLLLLVIPAVLVARKYARLTAAKPQG